MPPSGAIQEPAERAMRLFCFLLTGVLTVTTPIVHAQIPDRTDPAAYSCAEFIAAGTPPSRERAERMVYWATGYMRGKLTGIATIGVHTWSFDELAGHVTRALFDRCPADPALSIADIAEQVVQELTHTGVSKRWGSGDPR